MLPVKLASMANVSLTAIGVILIKNVIRTDRSAGTIVLHVYNVNQEEVKRNGVFIQDVLADFFV